MAKRITLEEIEQNLSAAGIKGESKKLLTELWEKGESKELVKYLIEKRSLILDQIHIREKQINCLDYLVYSLDKNIFNP